MKIFLFTLLLSTSVLAETRLTVQCTKPAKIEVGPTRRDDFRTVHPITWARLPENVYLEFDVVGTAQDGSSASQHVKIVSGETQTICLSSWSLPLQRAYVEPDAIYAPSVRVDYFATGCCIFVGLWMIFMAWLAYKRWHPSICGWQRAKFGAGQAHVEGGKCGNGFRQQPSPLPQDGTYSSQ